MAVDPATLAGAVFAGLSALIKISQQSAQFVRIPDEIQQLLINVNLADDAIITARRLQRDNPSRILGDRLMADVERSIGSTETILTQLRNTIEECNKDLKTRKTVGLRSRASWMLWKEREFSGNLATLTNALSALNRDIGRMEIAARTSSPGLPSYNQVIQNEWGRGRGFPRAPSMRKAPVKTRFGHTEGSESDQIDMTEPEGSAIFNEENEGRHLTMPPLVHMQSAPVELPQTDRGRWSEADSEGDSCRQDDVITDLREFDCDERYLRPTSQRRRSNFI